MFCFRARNSYVYGLSIIIFILVNVFAHPYWIDSYFSKYGKNAAKATAIMQK